MHLAVSKNMVQTMECFLALEEPAPVPDLEIKNNQGFTVLHIAAANGFFKICEILMETGKYF